MARIDDADSDEVLAELHAHDRSRGRFVAAADEAGRGCLAGPLIGAAVLFDLDRPDLLGSSTASGTRRS